MPVQFGSMCCMLCRYQFTRVVANPYRCPGCRECLRGEIKMAYAQMRFEGAAEHHNGGPTCLVFKREDGHELSLSSYRKGLIHFDGGDTVKDYGSFVTAEQFLAALLEFTASPILPPAGTESSVGDEE